MTTDPMLAYRISALEALFRQIADTRMAGLPIVNGALRIEAVGFEPCASEPDLPAAASGVLVTPWFMNLVRLPLAREDELGRVGVTRRLAVGREHFDFIGAHEAAIGTFDACSLFSPMFDFASQDTAVATAQAVLARLREPLPEVANDAAEQPERPARRGFLFGRSRAP
ncbi:MAG: [NiFe]-hydrogenase assembly chaperone HybE [Methyloversatilis sp.]|nr:[NiFe]-hydrogenase assembly chaperone HybE [Methyloversatilis sp.]